MIKKKDSLFRNSLLHLVLPIAFQQFMYALVSASDAVMLGLIDQSSMAAVSLATQVSFVFSLFLAAFTIGETIFAAQYWGKGDTDAVERILGVCMRVSVFTGVVFFLLTLFTPSLIMRIFTNEDTLIAAGVEYLRVVSISYLFSGISQCYLCIMKNSENAAAATRISAVMVALNIVLNAWFIFGLFGLPRMGVAGAALATSITRLVEIIWIAVWMAADKRRMQLRPSYLMKPDKLLRKDFWVYTAPVLGNQLAWGWGFAMYSVIMGHMGTDAVAANSLASIIKNLLACFCIGLASGGSILVGNELGAGKLDTGKKYGQQLVVLSIVSGAITGAIILLIMPLILRFSTLSAVASGYLKWMLIICSVNIIGMSINTTTIGGIFCAGGDSKFGFVCDAVTMWCVTVPLGLIAAFLLKWPVPIVYLIVNSDEIIKLPVVFWHYGKYRWVKNLTKEAD